MVNTGERTTTDTSVLTELIETEFRNRVPTKKAPFTIADIRRAIPAHCFERSLIHSFGYLLLDLCIVFSLLYLTKYIDSVITDDVVGSKFGPVLRSVLWITYWVVNGSVMTGLWVLGHECGHGGFADSTLINDVVGLAIHSFLLVPFFSWKVSHRRHHSNTGSLDKDEVFVPPVRDAQWVPDQHDDDPLSISKAAVTRLVGIFVMLVFGWPLYLWTNATGHKSYPKGRWVNHYLPASPIFSTQKERIQVVISDIALVLVIALYAYISYLHSLIWFVKVYFIPYLIVNSLLVIITYLQHTDWDLPHYAISEWDWLRGALCTVDRDYGVLNKVLHRITDTHVVHHLFSSMPFYHAGEATQAVRELLGPYYRYDNTNIFKAMWVNYACEFDQPDRIGSVGILWFRSPVSRLQVKQAADGTSDLSKKAKRKSK